MEGKIKKEKKRCLKKGKWKIIGKERKMKKKKTMAVEKGEMG